MHSHFDKAGFALEINVVDFEALLHGAADLECEAITWQLCTRVAAAVGVGFWEPTHHEVCSKEHCAFALLQDIHA